MDSNQNKHLTVSTGEAALDLLPVLGPRSSQTGPVCSLAAAGTPRGWARGGGCHGQADAHRPSRGNSRLSERPLLARPPPAQGACICRAGGQASNSGVSWWQASGEGGLLEYAGLCPKE